MVYWEGAEWEILLLVLSSRGEWVGWGKVSVWFVIGCFVVVFGRYVVM